MDVRGVFCLLEFADDSKSMALSGKNVEIFFIFVQKIENLYKKDELMPIP